MENTLGPIRKERTAEKESDGMGIHPLVDASQLTRSATPVDQSQTPTTTAPIQATEKEQAESSLSLPDSENIEGESFGFYTLRASPNIDAANVLGKLDGSMDHQLLLKGKIVGDGVIWYKVQFLNPKVYKKLTTKNPEAGKDLRAQNSAWLIEDGIKLILSFDQFLRIISKYEAENKDKTVHQRLTFLRQIGQKDLEDQKQVFHLPSGSIHQEDRVQLSDVHQLFLGPKAVRVPDGSVVDMHHLFIGLDALRKGNKTEDVNTLLGNAGENKAAATWSGDIGAAVADMVGKSASAYEENGFDGGMREFYFKSRAPESDLLADIDAFGAVDLLDSGNYDSLESLVRKYYGIPIPMKSVERPSLRKQAIINFLKHYGFSSSTNLASQDAAQKMTKTTERMATVWFDQKHKLSLFLNPLHSFNYGKIKEESGEMTKLFLQWLEGQISQNGVVFPEPKDSGK